MAKKIQFFIMIGALLSIIALATNTHATENPDKHQASNKWEVRDYFFTMDRPWHKETREDAIAGELIFTTSAQTNGLVFTCLEKKFRATTSVEPQNLLTLLKRIRYGRGFKYVDMRVDGGPKISLKRWHYDPNNTFMQSETRSAAARLYNAIISGKQVVLYIEGRQPLALDLPKPNRAFAEFGAECGLGKFAKKK